MATSKSESATTTEAAPEKSSYDELAEAQAATAAEQAKADEEEAKALEGVLKAAEALPNDEPRATIEQSVHQRQAALGVDRTGDEIPLDNPQTLVNSPSAVATGEEKAST